MDLDGAESFFSMSADASASDASASGVSASGVSASGHAPSSEGRRPHSSSPQKDERAKTQPFPLRDSQNSMFEQRQKHQRQEKCQNQPSPQYATRQRLVSSPLHDDDEDDDDASSSKLEISPNPSKESSVDGAKSFLLAEDYHHRIAGAGSPRPEKAVTAVGGDGEAIVGGENDGNDEDAERRPSEDHHPPKDTTAGTSSSSSSKRETTSPSSFDRAVPTSPAITHSQSHDAVLLRDPHHHHHRNHHDATMTPMTTTTGDSSAGAGSKLSHKNLLTCTMEDQAILMKTRMRSLSLPYALKVKSPETIAKESGSVWRSIFLSPKGFLVVLCVAVLAQSMLVSGYIPSIITTIQKRFQFSSKRTGMIISSYDVANLCMVPLVSYFGAKGRRPLWLCMGAMLIFVAAIGFTMPYFLSANYQLNNSTGNSSISDALCHGGKGQTIADQAKFFELFYFHKGPSTSECNGGPAGHESGSKGHSSWPSLTPQSWPFYVFLVSLCAFGIGSTPFYTLGTAYLHDNSPEEVVSVYVGILYAMGALGPAIGFLFGALFISFYEDPFNGPPKGVSEGDLAWVGAWWGGIIIGAILIFIFGITLFFFPKQILRKTTGKKKEEEEEKEDTEKSLVMTEEVRVDKVAEDSACYSYDRTHSVESGDASYRPVSDSTWASSSVTDIDTGRGSSSACTNACASSGSGSCSSPEVVFSGDGDAADAGCQASPRRPNLTVQQRHQSKATEINEISQRATNNDNDENGAVAQASCNNPKNPAGRDFTAALPAIGGAQKQHASSDDDDSFLAMPSLLDSNAPKTLLCIWAFVHSFLVDLFSILFNPVWLLLTLFTVGEVIVVDAFIVFGPKYIQTVFNVDASSANILAGIVMVPSAVIGMILGGVLIRRFRLSLRGQLWFLVLCAVTSLSAVFGLMFVSCTNVQIAGFNIGYDTREPDMNVTVNYLPTANLTSHCNLNCDCDDHWYEPVCGANQKTYFNPCYAGCQDLKVTNTPEGTTIWNYTQCSCVYSDIEYRHNGFDRSGANAGRCHQPCHSIYVFLLIFAIAVFAGCCAQSPVLVITLGTVDENMKSFALGLQYFLQRGMAYIPTPIYFGYIIDSTCLIWQWNCASTGEGGVGHDTRGLCLEYDRKRLPPTMFGSSLVVKTLGLLILVTCALRMRNQPDDDEKKDAKPNVTTTATTGAFQKHSRSTPTQTPKIQDVGAPPFAVDVTPISGNYVGTEDSAIGSSLEALSEKTPKNRSKGRTSRRALFRHRKLEDLCSDDDSFDASFASPDDQKSSPGSKENVLKLKETPAKEGDHDREIPITAASSATAAPSTTTTHQQALRATPSRRSAKKGDVSFVQYNRMRNPSDVEIDLADHL